MEHSSCHLSVSSKDTRNNLHDEVDAANLVHELDTVREQHTTSGLDFVLLEELIPAVLALLLFELQHLQHIPLLSLNSRVMLWRII